MASDAARVAGLLREDKALACGYERAFGEAPGGDDEKLLVDAAKALAAFQADAGQPRTPFDDFRDALVAGDREAAARYPAGGAARPEALHRRGNCAACHFGPLFTNGEFGDIGIPFFVRPGEVDQRPPRRHRALATAARSTVSAGTTTMPRASARLRTRHVAAPAPQFRRVPRARPAPGRRTGPFMHDGSLATLEDVVKHYSDVNPDRLHSDGVPLVRPLALSAEESADLVAFLRTLSIETPQSRSARRSVRCCP